jgi:hypothetical protein
MLRAQDPGHVALRGGGYFLRAHFFSSQIEL